MNNIIREYEAPLLRQDLPYFRPGDTITVSVRVVEGDKERIQDYTGVVIARRGGGTRETITVRRVSFGVGMERVFPIHSPRIAGIKVKRRGKVRRAKLYYLRDLSGKKARLTERKVSEEKLASEAASDQKSLLDQIALLEQPAPEAPAEAAAPEAAAPEAAAPEAAAPEAAAEEQAPAANLEKPEEAPAEGAPAAEAPATEEKPEGEEKA